MAHYAFQAILGASTGLPRDQVVNTFHVNCDDGEEELVGAELLLFYGSISNWFSPAITREAATSFWRSYRMSDPEPRVPTAVGVLPMTAADSSTSLPLEVSLCLSYRATVFSSGASQGRYRGRIYLGPFISEACETSGVYPRPADLLIEDVTEAATNLKSALEGLGIQWSVYSRVDNALRTIGGGWVDNEWDTQRRRGRDASARTVWE